MLQSPEVVLITGASTGFGRLTARTLANSGYIVYAGHHRLTAAAEEEARSFCTENKCDLRPVEMDVISDTSIAAAVKKIIETTSKIDILVHNAGHMVLGPAEAFTPEQYHQFFGINCVSTQRVNQAVLPHMRRAKSGLLIWVSSSSVGGPSQPFLAPYFAAKAAMDSLAQTYAPEISLWGIDTSIVVPGIFTSGTEHFANAGKAENLSVQEEYFGEGKVYHGWLERSLEGAAKMGPSDADPQDVAKAILKVMKTPKGRRPFRVHVEPAWDGSEVVHGVCEQIRRGYLIRMGCEELLTGEPRFRAYE